jgi:hypothetical protein
MTDTPDDLPSPDEYLRKMAHVDQEFADARRYLSALCAEDNQALGALMAEIHRSLGSDGGTPYAKRFFGNPGSTKYEEFLAPVASLF